MKILFIFSFYTALRSSFENGDWRPEGMPTAAKLFEGLKKKNIDYNVVFIDKNKNTKEKIKVKKRIIGLNRYFYLISIPNRKILSKFRLFKKINSYINEAVYIKEIMRLVKKDDFDLFYIDRDNVIIGAALKLLFKKKVLLRLHGVANLYDDFIKLSKKIIDPIRYFSFRCNFDYILCSNDGSPGKQFLESFTSSKIKKQILLNGIDISVKPEEFIETKNQQYNSKPVLLYLGRLDVFKGIEYFLDTVTNLYAIRDDFQTLIVGEGPLYDMVKMNITNYPNISLIGGVTHSKVHEYYNSADIYVSLNLLGNLSNTVLEALGSGLCVITLKKDVKSKKDFSTEELLEDTVIYIDRDNICNELPEYINNLLDNKQLLEEYKEKALVKSKQIIKSWNERIEYEIQLLEAITQL